MKEVKLNRGLGITQVAFLLSKEGFTFRIHGYEVISLSPTGGLYISVLEGWNLAIIKVYNWSNISLEKTVDKVRNLLQEMGMRVEIYW